MLTDCLATSDARWTALLTQTPHDIYHLPGYVEIDARREGAEPTAFLACEGNCFLLIPLLILPLPENLKAPDFWRDAKSPYGYPTPLFRGNAEWIKKALTAFISKCQTWNIVTVFLRMHPLLPVPPVPLEYGELVTHGQTVYIDVTLTEAQLWSQIRERSRSYITRLQRAGFRAQMDDWSRYNEFVSIYGQTMERVHANDFYKFSPQYFRDLRDKLGRQLHYCSIADPNGQLACGGIFGQSQTIMQYHLSGTADAFLSKAPSKLMLYEATLWAKKAGCTILSLGGGRGARPDSLFHFKSGFSPLRSDFLTYRLVCDQGKYASLTRGTEADEVGDEYFPRYRRLV